MILNDSCANYNRYVDVLGWTTIDRKCPELKTAPIVTITSYFGYVLVQLYSLL